MDRLLRRLLFILFFSLLLDKIYEQFGFSEFSMSKRFYTTIFHISILNINCTKTSMTGRLQ